MKGEASVRTMVLDGTEVRIAFWATRFPPYYVVQNFGRIEVTRMAKKKKKSKKKSKKSEE